MPPIREPSDLELQVLCLLWERGPLTARQVLESLPDKKPRAYTTVLSVMQVMEKKGLLTHTSVGNTHLYRSLVARAKILPSFLSRLVNVLFAGKPAQAIQALLREESITAEELAAIRQLLDERSPRSAAGKSTRQKKE